MFEYKAPTNPIFKYIFWCFSPFLLLFFGLSFVALAVDLAGRMGERGVRSKYSVVSVKSSPDGKNVAIVYVEEGVEKSGWSFLRAAVYPADKSFEPAIDNNYFLELKGGREITTIWDGNSNLIILYAYKPGEYNTYYRKENVSAETGVSIKYVGNPVE